MTFPISPKGMLAEKFEKVQWLFSIKTIELNWIEVFYYKQRLSQVLFLFFTFWYPYNHSTIYSIVFAAEVKNSEKINIYEYFWMKKRMAMMRHCHKKFFHWIYSKFWTWLQVKLHYSDTGSVCKVTQKWWRNGEEMQ